MITRATTGRVGWGAYARQVRRRWKRALVKTGVVAVLLLAAAVVVTYRQGGFIRDQVSAESSVLMAGDEGLALMTRSGPPRCR